jgi:uncharacterized protein with ParB-like and HNH nuclease domain
MNNPSTILQLLTDNNSFAIPLYQRNFAWTEVEISQLVIDVLDAIKDSKKDYYIGTLVVCKNGEKYDIIDGQQRFTALALISLAIQNRFNEPKRINTLNLSFTARKDSSNTLNAILENKTDIGDNEVSAGYETAFASLKEYLGKYKEITIARFFDYLLNNVKIFINEMPKDTDVNLYFERFNSRGEQLEYHEIIKAELMQRLYNETKDSSITQKFAKIWEACSEVETPCIKFFKKKIKYTDPDDEREKIFGDYYEKYDLDEKIYNYIIVNNENKCGLLDEFTEPQKDETEQHDESNKYRCVVRFNTFLYYVLYITDGENVDDIQLDDKKLKSSFKINNRDKEWILKFGKNLLQCKFLFDNFIIRQSQETSVRLKDEEWFLHKACREDNRYVQTRFDKNSFTFNNDEIVMLQSMFVVTFTAQRDTKWLFETMKYLFDNSNKIEEVDDVFGDEGFCLFLEDLARKQFKRMLGTVDANNLRYDKDVPIYAFNLVDYVLWKNKSNMKKTYPNIKFDEFMFKYRHSIEHWYPQHPNEKEGNKEMLEDLRHSFGNLCIISASQNSRFGNLCPDAKLKEWRHNFSTQSLKLQMMAQITEVNGSWEEKDKAIINKFENEILKLLQDFIAKSLATDGLL